MKDNEAQPATTADKIPVLCSNEHQTNVLRVCNTSGRIAI